MSLNLKQSLLALLFLISITVTAQVGIGNTDPKATLDISATNVATPSNTDGILIPRIDEFPAVSPTADQDGMLVFVSGNGTPTKGFYYWDNSGAGWVSIYGSSITASNGLTATANNVRLGGTLTQNTDITHNVYDTNFNLNSLGEFRIQDDGTTFFEATQAGTVNVGGNLNYNTREILNVFGTQTSPSNYIANFQSNNSSPVSNGVSIRLRANVVSSSGYYIGFYRFGGNTVSGSIAGSGSGVMYATVSDRRLKNSITNITNSLELINKIQPRLYEYNDISGVKEYGFIAQELQAVFPQAVSGNPTDDVKTNPMMVDYGRLTPILTAGIKELFKEIKDLKKENQILKVKLTKLDELEARLIIIENNKNN